MWLIEGLAPQPLSQGDHGVHHRFPVGETTSGGHWLASEGTQLQSRALVPNGHAHTRIQTLAIGIRNDHRNPIEAKRNLARFAHPQFAKPKGASCLQLAVPPAEVFVLMTVESPNHGLA